MRIAFLSSTPLNIREGSGTFAAIRTLSAALAEAGVAVEMVAPREDRWPLALRRLRFNHQLRSRDWSGFDAIVGFDFDGCRVRAGVPVIAAPKGVVADEMRFERGLTRAAMRVQALCERRSARRADGVIATSQYSARVIEHCYQVPVSAIVPEPIHLAGWRTRLPARTRHGFTVLSVCRLYPRKRMQDLIAAAALVRDLGIAFRVVGDGPQRERLRSLPGADALTWLGYVDDAALLDEYANADVFCLPSAQEGFGIVLLEAMASRVPIVAARAGAIPEVATAALLTDVGDAAAIAHAIRTLHGDASLRADLAARGAAIVERYDAGRVAREFIAGIRAIST